MFHAEKVGPIWIEKSPAQFMKEKNASIPSDEFGDYHLDGARLLKITIQPRPADQPGSEILSGELIDVDGRPVRSWLSRDMTAEEMPAEMARQSAAMRQRVRDSYSEAMRPISEAYPLEEREGWPEQIEAAKVVTAGGVSDLIDVLAAPRGLSAAEMAQTILQKQAGYRVIYGAMTANLHRLIGLIEAAVTLADLVSIDVANGWELPGAG